jgi:hypothetical protein
MHWEHADAVAKSYVIFGTGMHDFVVKCLPIMLEKKARISRIIQ